MQVVAAIIEKPDRRLLIGQRRADDSSPLKWEFPGGKVEPGESDTEALARELREELGVTLLRQSVIAQTQYEYPDREPLTVTFFAVSIAETELQPRAFERIAWVLPRELSGYDFLPANARLISELATGRIKPQELLRAAPEA
jgi:8-oxo-dGTP diphosphatase